MCISEPPRTAVVARSSAAAPARPRAALRSAAAAVALVCLAALGPAALSGCARAIAQPPGAASRTEAPAEGSDSTTPASAPQTLDPSEEITPGELSSIPDPVPSERAAGPRASALGTEGARVEGPDPTGGRSPSRNRQEAAAGDSETAVPAFRWRVQVFAAQDLGIADRKAKEAEARLGVKASLEFEAPYYKVRLGGYASEEEAQSLREKAIQAGYLGAFRVRCAPDSTQ